MRRKADKIDVREHFVHEITREKLEEFRFMSAEARLQWLEDANNFIHKFLKKEKRIRWDNRF